MAGLAKATGFVELRTRQEPSARRCRPRPENASLKRLTITAAAFEAIAALPFGSAVFERDPDAKGDRQIWLEPRVLDRLKAMRGPGESYSDVILRVAESS